MLYLGGPLQDLAYDAGQGEVFVAAGNGVEEGATPTVWVISDSTNAIVANITMASAFTPTGVAYDASKGEVFVTDAGNNGNVFGGVYVISDSTNTASGYIYVGNYPEELTYDSGMGEVFVANYGSSSVSVISDSTNAVVATVAVGNYPSGIAYDSSKGEIFVANTNDNTVSVISDTTNAVVATVTGLSGYEALGIEGVAYDSGKGEIFAGNVVISDSANTVVAQLPFNIGDVVYDSGKGEVIAAASTGLDVFSDFSSTSTTSTSSPSATSTVSASSTPKVPEFSSAALVSSCGSNMIVVTLCSVALTARTKKSIRT